MQISENKLAEQLKAEAKLYGFRCEDVKHDGNCFYNALANQLSSVGNSNNNSIQLPTTHVALREKAAKHIIEHINDYKGFSVKTPDELANEALDQGRWANNLMIQAISRELNITIVSLQSDGSEPIIIRQRHPICTIFVGYEIGLHYQSLIRDNTITNPSRNIQNLIDRAPIDSGLLTPRVALGSHESTEPNPSTQLRQ